MSFNSTNLKRIQNIVATDTGKMAIIEFSKSDQKKLMICSIIELAILGQAYTQWRTRRTFKN